ncbi:MAG TPA: glycosyltransferase [Anaerolineae bacterium]|nr:glycosyltransferase [Anaerolineae bacterium]
MSLRRTGRSQILISVVIPAHNEERYLGACLEALQRQRYPRSRFEVIVVDNASTDATPRIARQFGAMVVTEPRMSIGRARQRGADTAQGDILASTDADTIVPPDWLERIALSFQRDRELGAVFGPFRYSDGTALEKVFIWYLSLALMMALHALRRSCFSGNNYAVRREAFWRAGGNNVSLPAAEDVDLSWRLSKVTRVAFDRDLIVRTSARRRGEGYGRILWRTVRSGLRMILMQRPPYPLPVIR